MSENKGLSKEDVEVTIDLLNEQLGPQYEAWDGVLYRIPGTDSFRVYAVQAPDEVTWSTFQKGVYQGERIQKLDLYEVQKKMVLGCLISSAQGNVAHAFEQDVKQRPKLVDSLFLKITALADQGVEDLKKG